MKWMISIMILVVSTLQISAENKPRDLAGNDAGALSDDSLNHAASLAEIAFPELNIRRSGYGLHDMDKIIADDENMQFSLGMSKEGRNINAYFIPGTSDQRALVLAGVHGSELSAIEVTYQLVRRLLTDKKPYYSVIVVSCLFPDNAFRAMNAPELIGSGANVGRYSHGHAVDPNRQMPSPGKDFNDQSKTDHLGRKIEQENVYLLELIRRFRPQRIANIHAIRDTGNGGVYADPRTDHRGIALGYSSDSSLAVEVASYIREQGGRVAGNKLDLKPTALYYKDPAAVPAGTFQKRNMTGSKLNESRGSGVSLGTWASTAISGERDSTRNRPAIRILTIEYPGYKRPVDYKTDAKQLGESMQAKIFADAIGSVFLAERHVEPKNADYVKN